MTRHHRTDLEPRNVNALAKTCTSVERSRRRRMELCLGESVGAFVVEISKDFSVCRRFCGSGCPRAAYSLWVHRLGLHHPYVVPPWFALLYSLSRYPQPVTQSRCLLMSTALSQAAGGVAWPRMRAMPSAPIEAIKPQRALSPPQACTTKTILAVLLLRIRPLRDLRGLLGHRGLPLPPLFHLFSEGHDGRIDLAHESHGQPISR